MIMMKSLSHQLIDTKEFGRICEVYTHIGKKTICGKRYLGTNACNDWTRRDTITVTLKSGTLW